MGKKALITGIVGQDGYWLTKHLLELGYEVHGFIRRHANGCLNHLPQSLRYMPIFHYVDVTDAYAVTTAMGEIKPDEIYHLAAFSSVRNSWTSPELALNTNTLGTLNMLNAMHAKCPKAAMYFAGSSEQFGDPDSGPQDERTPFNPLSPYGISKTAAYQLCRSYRDTYGLDISLGVSYNHDSFCRPTDFVMAKICAGAAAIAAGDNIIITLGLLDSVRDFGYAKDFAVAYHNALTGIPDEYVFATGELHSIRDICNVAFVRVGMPITWGQNPDGECAVTAEGQVVIQTNANNIRPNENKFPLVGDSTKAINAGVFKSTKSFTQVVEEIVDFHRKGLKPT